MLKGELENTHILNCQKTNQGLLCLLESTVFTDYQKFDAYSLINYKGIQLKFEGDYLVKQGSEWGVLQCENNLNQELDLFDSCQYVKLDSDCSSVLKRETIKPFLDNCVFEKITPKISEITKNGVLVQGENLEVQLLDTLTDYRPDKIYEAPPMLIATNKIVRVIQNNFEETIHPKNLVTSEKIMTTWLSDEDIKSLENKMKINEILDFDYYTDIGGALVLSLVILVLGFVFKKQREISQKVNNDVEGQAKKAKAKLNLKENKRIQF
jgi:hypothetical protein